MRLLPGGVMTAAALLAKTANRDADIDEAMRNNITAAAPVADSQGRACGAMKRQEV